MSAIEGRILRAAKALAPYQATRWALATLREGQPRRLATTWTSGSGDLPPVLTWESCLADASRLVDDGQRRALHRDDLEIEATRFRERFEDEAFRRAAGHLVWFSGKDIKKQMQKDDANLFGLDGYLSWAVSRVDWRLHPDLAALAAELAVPA